MSYFISSQCSRCKFNFPVTCDCKYIKDVDLETYCVEWTTDIEEATDFTESASCTLSLMGYKKFEHVIPVKQKIYTKPRYMGIIIRNI